MEKIVLVSGEPKYYEYMIALIEAVFPECDVEIVGRPGSRPGSAERGIHASIGLYPSEHLHQGTGI